MSGAGNPSRVGRHTYIVYSMSLPLPHFHTFSTSTRLKDELGMCKVGRKALVSTVAPHFAEEQPLQGRHGSGTVFFSMCNLRCVFCQNWDISQQRAGGNVS